MWISEDAFRKFFNDYCEQETIDQDAIDTNLDRWKHYREKILNRTLTGIEYNSVKENFVGQQYNSLQYFIEKDTEPFGGFGAMVSGKLVLWIQGVEPDTKWFEQKSDGARFVLRELTTAEDKQHLENEIRNYLYNLCTQYSFDDLVAFLNDQNNLTKHFGPKAFLARMIILNSWLENEYVERQYDYHCKLLFIYDFSRIEEINLFSELKNEQNNIKKNKMLTEKALSLLGIDNPTTADLIKIERCIWRLSGGNPDLDLLLSDEKKNIIFYGAPGTGKTYTIKALTHVDGVECMRVQFHPGFTYEDFIEGIKPVGIDTSGNLKFEVVNGCFKELCIKARDNPDTQYYFIADEVNRANLSVVFGEALSLLENTYRFDENRPAETTLKTPLSQVIKNLYEEATDKTKVEKLIFYRDSDGDIKFGIPKNVHFIGMMNDVDKSIDSFDLALRRRFTWVRKDFDANVISVYLRQNNVEETRINDYIKSCSSLNYYITGYHYSDDIDYANIESLNLGKSYEFGHSIFMRIPKEYISRRSILKAAMPMLWNEHIEPVLREYLRSNLPETEIDSKIKTARGIFVR